MSRKNRDSCGRSPEDEKAYATALKWYKDAAREGHPVAQHDAVALHDLGKKDNREKDGRE